MGLPKGRTNNPRGRKKGSENKVTKELRPLIKQFLDKNFVNVQKEFDNLDSKDKLLFYKDMLKFCVPTMQATSLNVDFEKLSDEQLDEIINRLSNID